MTLKKCKGLCDENEHCKYISYPIGPKKVDGECRLIRSCDDTQKYEFPRITFGKVKVVVKGILLLLLNCLAHFNMYVRNCTFLLI
jgi:hypothetical protein